MIKEFLSEINRYYYLTGQILLFVIIRTPMTFVQSHTVLQSAFLP